MVETVGKSRKFTSDGISRTGGAEIVKKKNDNFNCDAKLKYSAGDYVDIAQT